MDSLDIHHLIKKSRSKWDIYSFAIKWGWISQVLGFKSWQSQYLHIWSSYWITYCYLRRCLKHLGCSVTLRTELLLYNYPQTHLTLSRHPKFQHNLASLNFFEIHQKFYLLNKRLYRNLVLDYLQMLRKTNSK